MPVSPKDIQPVIEKKKSEFNAKVSALENEIDKKIMDKAPEPGYTIEYMLPIDITDEMANKIVNDYTSVGWEVTIDIVSGIEQYLRIVNPKS